MKTSELIDKIAPAFLSAQKNIVFAVKDATNPHLRNKYADLPSVISAVKGQLNDAGISIIQTAGDVVDGKLSLSTILMHESGQWFRSDTTMPLPKQDPQGYGSAITYARRYALSAITGLYQDDDDGNAASGVNGNGNITVMQSNQMIEEYEKAKKQLLSIATEQQRAGIEKWLKSNQTIENIKKQIERLENENRKQEAA